MDFEQRRLKDEIDEFVFRNGWTQFRGLKAGYEIVAANEFDKITNILMFLNQG